MAYAKGKKNNKLMTPKPVTGEFLDLIDEIKPKSALAKKVLKDEECARTEAVKLVWEYIKQEKLNSGREITLDATLKSAFNVKKSKVTMFEIAGLVSNFFE